jgi:phage host-nuclease inhibitor protein Gam
MSNLNFIESIKIVPDKEKEMLLKIQDEIAKRSNSKEDILVLTKNLSDIQKERLKQLYIEQIEKINSSTENYKKKILETKSNLEKLKKVN